MQLKNNTAKQKAQHSKAKNNNKAKQKHNTQQRNKTTK